MNTFSVIKRNKYSVLIPVAVFMAIVIMECKPRYAIQAAPTGSSKMADTSKGLKDYYKDYFPIGVAVSTANLHGPDSALIVKEFNSVTPENDMKMGPIHPSENVYNWKNADAIVDFAVSHHIK